MDPFDIWINPGSAQTTERGAEVYQQDTAKFAGEVRPRDQGGTWFEIGKNGLYVSVFIKALGATVQVLWGESYARDRYGEINPPALGTPVDVVFDNGIMIGHHGKTQLSEYNGKNRPPLHPRMLREWDGARLAMHGANGNVRMTDKDMNVDEIVLGNQTKHLVGGEYVVRQGPDISASEQSAFKAAEHAHRAVRSLDSLKRVD